MPTQYRKEEIVLRPSREEDLDSITDIYGYYVLHGTVSFETEAPDVEEMRRRRANLLQKRFPYLVAEHKGEILGYAYAGPYRPRTAYRNTAENSIYLHPNATGQGIGRLLLSELLKACEALGLRQMIAVIGGSENVASIRLHESLGFRMVGTLQAVGFKKGQWLDTVLLQRTLGPGDTIPPRQDIE